MKKFLLLFFIGCYTLGFSQLKYTEHYKLYESQIRYIGGTETYAYYMSWKVISTSLMTEELTYFKVPMSGGEPEFFEKEKLKIGDLNYRLMVSYVLNDEIYELYNAFKGGLYTVDGQAVLVKRETKNFDIVGTPKVIANHPIFSATDDPNVRMFIDDAGIVVVGEDVDKKEKVCYAKRFDLDLNEKWSVDISKFYSFDKKIVSKVLYDKKDKMLFFELNLAECEDCDGFQMFKRSKTYSTTVVGLMYINEDGEQITTVPEVPEGLIYSNSYFFYDNETDLVNGVFITHSATGDQFDVVSGTGYVFCQWNRETGEQTAVVKHVFKYGDLIDAETKKMLALEAPKETINGNDAYPRISGGFAAFKLSDGSYSLFAPSVYGSLSDPILNKSLNPKLVSTKFIAHLDATGKMDWSKAIPFYPGESIQGFSVTEDDRMIFVTTGYRKNYVNGKYELVGANKSFDAYCIVEIDMKTGEVLTRKQFEEKSIADEYNSTITQFNEPANKVVFGFQSSSGTGFRKVAFGLLSLER